MEKKKEKKERKREREIINSRKLQTTFLSLSYSNAEGGRKKEREGEETLSSVHGARYKR